MNRVRMPAVSGLLTALAFGLSFLERTVLLPLSVPGFKPGLANVVTLFAVYHLGAFPALLILLGRCILSFAFFGSQFIFAMTGGLAALGVMILLKRFKGLSPYGVSMAGAAAHNIGQVFAAIIVAGDFKLISYLPVLLPVSVPAGFLMGFLYNCVKKTNRLKF